MLARWRAANQDASAGTVPQLQPIVGQIRQHGPQVKIVVRGDRGFAREEIRAWGEANPVESLFGLAKKARLLREVAAERGAGPAAVSGDGPARTTL